MKRYNLGVSRAGLIGIGIITVLFLLFWYIQGMAKPIFYSCTQAKAAGYHDIMKGSQLYRPDLDKDEDGVACE